MKEKKHTILEEKKTEAISQASVSIFVSGMYTSRPFIFICPLLVTWPKGKGCFMGEAFPVAFLFKMSENYHAIVKRKGIRL